MVAGLIGYILRQSEGEALVDTIRYGWIPTSTFIVILATFLIIAAYAGVRKLNKK
jgi:hypothetical protein